MSDVAPSTEPAAAPDPSGVDPTPAPENQSPDVSGAATTSSMGTYPVSVPLPAYATAPSSPVDPSQMGQTQQEASPTGPTPETPAVPAPPDVATAERVVPKDGFHDTREVAAAQAGGLPTPDGYPLAAAAQELLRELNRAHDGIEGWVRWARAKLAAASQIGADLT